jgi:hypothetical protein
MTRKLDATSRMFTPHITKSSSCGFKFRNNSIVTSFSHDVFPSNIPNFNSGATTPSNLLHVPHLPSSLARNHQPTT